jgi:hypothetical protein
MKRLILAAAIGLASCSTSPDLAAQIAAVQKTAMQVCGFLPYATTIAAIIGKNVAGLKTAGDIAKSICDAITPSGIKSASVNPPKVADVPVEGEFVGAKP